MTTTTLSYEEYDLEEVPHLCSKIRIKFKTIPLAAIHEYQSNKTNAITTYQPQ